MLTAFTYLANWLTYDVLGFAEGSKAGDAVAFFLEDIPKMFFLLAVMIYIIGYVRAGVDAKRIRDFLSGRNRFVCYFLAAALGALMDEIYEIPAFISQRLVDGIARMAQAGPDTLLFIVTALLGTYFISASFPKTNAFIAAQLPNSLLRKLEGLGADVRTCFGGFFRAQLILMCITFFELLAAFLRSASAKARFWRQ